MFLPLIICKIVFHFKIQQIIYRYVVKQNPKLKLKSLEQYDDYMESLKIREHLSYKLEMLLSSTLLVLYLELMQFISNGEIRRLNDRI